MNLARPGVVRLSSAAIVLWLSVVLPVANDSRLAKALATEAASDSDTVPGGATLRTMSATFDPLFTPPTLVTDATRSGRTAAT